MAPMFKEAVRKAQSNGKFHADIGGCVVNKEVEWN